MSETATTDLRPFRITTTRRVVVIEAIDADHAHRLFTGKEWPPNTPPAPRPANRTIPDSGGRIEPTPEWKRWYEDEFLPRRASYPVLAFARGECMIRVEAADTDW